MKLTTHIVGSFALAALLGAAPSLGLRKARSISRLHSNIEANNGTQSNGTDSQQPPAEWIEIPIDHNNKTSRKYRNRFWVDDSKYKPGGPIILYDVGEMDGESLAYDLLAGATKSFRAWLREFNAIGIVWEHRYYGKSLPFNITANTTSEQLRYLTIEQALADIPYFAKRISLPNYPHQDLTPTGTPWVMFGGSYPGERAAYMRHFYPETIFAAYASSAPVEHRVDYSEYFDQIHRGLVAYGYGNCTKDIYEAYGAIDRILGRNDSSSAALKVQFLGETADQNNNGDFTSLLTNVYSSWQDSGPSGFDGLGSFCDWLETDPTTNKTAPAEGWAPTKGADWVVNRFASWPGLAAVVNGNSYLNCRQEDKTSPLNCILANSTFDPTDMAWNWQMCTQVGFFQPDNKPPNSLISTFQTMAYNQQGCYSGYPDGLKSSLLPKVPRVNALNRWTGGWTLRPSNVFWTGGEFDPWRSASPFSTESYAPKDVQITSEIPKCGVSTAQNKLFGYLLRNSEHVFDLNDDWPPAIEARKIFSDALRQWLPCFRKKTC